jgi:hypothetical protein
VALAEVIASIGKPQAGLSRATAVAGERNQVDQVLKTVSDALSRVV